ncbi:MAG: DoxX family protein, partial [Chthoniobacteraceae bacterium]
MKTVLILFSAVSFLAYGSACFVSACMKREFERYGVGSLRGLVGGLQLCGAIGLLVGLSQPWMGRAAAAGLAVLMLLGVGVRIKIKDSLLQTTPALFYMVLNAYLFCAAFWPLSLLQKCNRDAHREHGDGWQGFLD